jgi:hypothetical protein
MSTKLNCWEFMNCGREPGGVLSATCGVCPVATAFQCDGANGGQAAGRTCWRISHSPGLNGQRNNLPRLSTCLSCAFYRRVQFEAETEAPLRPEIVTACK